MVKDAWPEFAITCDICRDLRKKVKATRIVVCRESSEGEEERYAVCDNHDEDMEFEFETGELIEYESWPR